MRGADHVSGEATRSSLREAWGGGPAKLVEGFSDFDPKACGDVPHNPSTALRAVPLPKAAL
jgi:hypothetical protein